jgi:proteasome assembly chaperone (PAC2) family protein
VALEARGFAEIDPLPFFDIDGASVEGNVIQTPTFPESKFYYWKDKKGGQDLIILEGDEQPSFHGYDMATRVLDFAQKLGVQRVYTVAAALVQQFTEKPRVWAAASEAPVLAELQGQGMELKGDFFVAGMNGLLLAVAKERDMEGVCLLGETPRFPAEVGNPFAVLAILERLAKVLHVGIDLSELRERAGGAHEEIEKLLSESRHDFLNQFTVSLWDRAEDEG